MKCSMFLCPDVPEFSDIIGSSLVEKLEQSSDHSQTQNILQKCFTALMTCDPDIVKEKLAALVKRLQDMSK